MKVSSVRLVRFSLAFLQVKEKFLVAFRAEQRRFYDPFHFNIPCRSLFSETSHDCGMKCRITHNATFPNVPLAHLKLRLDQCNDASLRCDQSEDLGNDEREGDKRGVNHRESRDFIK